MEISLKKIFCLDTNVLLYDPQSIFSFGDNDIVIPLVVLEEIDRVKNRQDEIGFNARQTARNLDKLRESGSLPDGVPLETGGSLRVVKKSEDGQIPQDLGKSTKADNIILSVTIDMMNQNDNVTLITKDINVRVKADALKIPCQDYSIHKIASDASSLYTGVKSMLVSEKDIAKFYEKSGLKLSKKILDENKIYPNQFLVMKSDPESKATIGRVIDTDSPVKPLGDMRKIWGLKPRNKEQRFALDILLDPNVKLVTLVGKAGGGKTLLAASAGIEQVMHSEIYSKLIISRPILSAVVFLHLPVGAISTINKLG